ncbi:MAG: hypothetical protein ACREA4_00455 [Nitrososphaera sp.]
MDAERNRILDILIYGMLKYGMTELDEGQSITKSGFSVKDFLEDLWRVTTGITLAFYLIGFIVVNVHLARFGYYAVSLVNAQYLSAAVWTLVPVVVGWSIVFFGILCYVPPPPPHKKDPSWVANFEYLKIRLLVELITIVSFVVLLVYPQWVAGLPFWLRVIIFVIAGVLFSRHVLIFASSWLGPLSILARKVIFLIAVQAIFACFFPLVYILTFSSALYGDIPTTWGGGKPRPVRLIVKNDVKQEIIAAGISMSERPLISEPVDLLLATEKEYIVLIGKERLTLSIRSDIIQAILYLYERD